jgi:hypothetical protein
MAELEKLMQSGNDTFQNKKVVRLDNRVKNSFVDPITGTLT